MGKPQKRYYTDEDVKRWEEADEKGIQLQLEKLPTETRPKAIDFRLGMLSLGYDSRGMTLVAKERFTEAIDAFRSSVEFKCKMYERYEAGVGEVMEAGYFQNLLVAFVTKDDALISRLGEHYRADAGTPDSLYLGRILKCIVMNDLDGAKRALQQKKPRFERQFTGYPDCFEAIVEKDPVRFVEAINVASQNWAKWASRTVRGLPHAVCFIQGVGLTLLAQRVIGQPIPVVNDYIPPQLL